MARSGTACRRACCIIAITSACCTQRISPYVVPGRSARAESCRASAASLLANTAQGDKRVQAYCYRMCLTDHPGNRIPFPKPDGYDPKQYELLLRVFEAGWRETFDKFDPIPNRKTDTQQSRAVQHRQHRLQLRLSRSSVRAPARDLEGARDLSEGMAVLHRERSARAEGRAGSRCASGDCRRTSSRTTETGRTRSTCARHGAWMGTFVMTENELMKKRPTPESVGMGSYTIDSHNVQRYITPEGYVQNEGDIGVTAERAVRDRVRRARPEARPGGQPARAGLRVELAHRVRLDPDGAGIHDPGAIGRDGGGDGDRSRTSPCRTFPMRSCASDC